ncbi:MAG TPA: alpha/beta hydrolase-fold protein [Bryobacteraceae bacterium]|nr:alpha/beta hydrolase-fold protein [Bryobacteraceae bacterium]
MPSNVELSELSSIRLPEPVPYAVITPPGPGPFPLCLVLMGGGGSRQSLIDCQPLFDRWWDEGSLAPMVFATPSAGLSYYVEDPKESVRWDSFLVDDFVPHLRSACNVTFTTAITGMSMGGYGALKIAFAHPEKFAAVAAINPMLEPGFRDAEIRARNRLHHTSGGPARLVGPSRDPDLFAANNPANRARRNADRIRESGVAIYLDAGDRDFVNAHDGTEFLHRVLWSLDISHEYHLVRGADHGGSTFRPRMRAAFAWLTAVLAAPAEPTAEDRALDAIRAQLQPLRDQAAASDPTVARRFGVLSGA